jgi:putative SOS response-associated peptidase YedK
MLVILPREVEQVLDQSIVDSTFLKNLLVPYPPGKMMAYGVSTFVNSVNNGPECLVAVGGGAIFIAFLNHVILKE